MVRGGSSSRAGARLGDLVDLEAQRLRDAAEAPNVLRVRDRAIGRELGGVTERRELLIGWIRKRQAMDTTLPGRRVERGLRQGCVVLCIVAMLVGMATAAGVLAYSGAQPVNVLGFVGVLVLPQMVLLMVWCVTMLPGRWLARLPIAGDLHGMLRELSPGRVVVWLMQKFSRRRQQDARAWMGVLGAMRQRYGEVMFLVMSGMAQTAGVFFNLGIIVAFVALVVFTDLAFGWSTTLRVEAETIHAITQMLSLPWAWCWDQAAPSLELIEQSRYFRMSGSAGGAADDPAVWGGWWPFLLACVVTYGLLPRVLAMGLVAMRKRGALAGLRLDHPDHTATVLRLGPMVQTTATEPSHDHVGEAGERGALRADWPPAISGRCVVLDWRGAGGRQAVIMAFLHGRLGYDVAATHTATGQSGAADEAAISACVMNDEVGGTGALPVVVLAKAWESPSRDLRVALDQLRKAVGGATVLTVCLVDQDETGAVIAPGEGDVSIWRRKLAELGDGQLFVVPYETVGEVRDA